MTDSNINDGEIEAVSESALNKYIMKPHTGPSLRLVDTKDLDVKCFPELFPDGKFGWDYVRYIILSKQEYIRSRLLNMDRRCAKSMAFICFAIGIIEQLEINAIKATLMRKTYKNLTVRNVMNIINSGQRGDFYSQVILSRVIL
jgi:hypothetical protein